MTNPEPEPSVPGSNPPIRNGWWRHPVTGAITVLIAWLALTWTMLSSTKDDIAAAEGRLKDDIAAAEGRLKEGITAVEGRLKEGITAVETRLKGEIAAIETRLTSDIIASEGRIDNHLARVEGRLDRIMEILLDEARRGDQQEAGGS